MVVYKIDRLTRSLPDFAKLVEVFDRNGVSFVSVTQQFNTTTSMGRLTLNILLSFAQFEREGHRRAHPRQDRRQQGQGMWMGGVPPGLHDVVERKRRQRTREAKRWCATSSGATPSMDRRRRVGARIGHRRPHHQGLG